MRLLIAEDDAFFQTLLQQILGPDHEFILANDGNEAWEMLQSPYAPRLAILDWVMPGLTGPQVCRKVRGRADLSSMYLIILTAKNSEADIVSGLRAGADDYITKPPMPAELRARVRAGERILALQEAVEAQSAFAGKSVARGGPGRKSSAGDPGRSGLPGQERLVGIGPCERLRCEPADCCSNPESEAGGLIARVAGWSLEKSHSHR